MRVKHKQAAMATSEAAPAARTASINHDSSDSSKSRDFLRTRFTPMVILNAKRAAVNMKQPRANNLLFVTPEDPETVECLPMRFQVIGVLGPTS